MKRLLDRLALAISALLTVCWAFNLALILSVAHYAGWFDREPPPSWLETAAADDRLVIPGREIVYWGKPDARYSRYATRGRKPPRAIVIHFTWPKPPVDIVTYGHQTDTNRGGASFGYHFYIGAAGKIYQGAPLSKRTNHIKFRTNAKRRGVAPDLWSGNTIGISLVGACNPLLTPVRGRPLACADEMVTGAQIEAGLAVIEALRVRFEIPCEAVYGHGELQTDRASFEGETLTKIAKDRCEADEVETLSTG